MYGWTQNTAARTESRGALSSGATTGTTITSGNPANTKGSWVSLGSVTSFSYEMLVVYGMANSAIDYIFDIGVTVGGNTFVLAGDLHIPGVKDNNTGCSYTLPLHVPSGSQLSARCSANFASFDATCSIIGFSCGVSGMPGYSRCIPLFTESASRGILVDPGGTANTKVRTEITSATTARIVAILFGSDNANDVARSDAQWLFDIEAGASSAEQILVPDVFLAAGTAPDLVLPSQMAPWPCDIPSGTRLSVNAQCSINTAGDRTFGCMLWGFVP